ncbi:MAG: hypothetical protein V1831_04310 [Candidatus Woesearchaeota archaeon]
MIKNKKSLGVISTLLTIILAIAMLVWIVFPAGKAAYAAFFGPEQDYIKSFEKFVDGINHMSSDGMQISVKLKKESAIIGFSKNTDRYECYRCDAPEGAMGFVSIIFERPKNTECSGNPCACLCSKGLKFEYKDFEGSKATVGECQDLVCKKLEHDIVDKVIVWVHDSYTDSDELAKRLQSPDQYIKLWMNGFLFANSLDDASELNKLNNKETSTLFVEKIHNYGPLQEGEPEYSVGVCNKEMFDFHNEILKKRKKDVDETEIKDDPEWNRCIPTI